MTSRRVYIVEDEAPIRRSSELMLRVLGFAPTVFETGTAFLRDADNLAPGCVLLDIRMPEIDGLEVQRRLNSTNQEHSVVMMSGHADIAVAAPAFENGAVAFLEKPFSRATLQYALDLAFAKLEKPEGYFAYLEMAERATGALAPADRQILSLLARGLVNEDIAETLGVPSAEVELSRSRILDRLGVDSTTEALRLAFAAARASARS